jgi:hypothetical protein
MRVDVEGKDGKEVKTGGRQLGRKQIQTMAASCWIWPCLVYDAYTDSERGQRGIK